MTFEQMLPQMADIWSFKFDVMYYTAGAARPAGEIITVNYDLDQGREIALGDLFLTDSNYLDLIANYCIAELKNQHGELFDPFGAEPKTQNYEDWNIIADGLLITFEQGEVLPAVAPAQTVLVPYNELRAIIDPQGPLAEVLR